MLNKRISSLALGAALIGLVGCGGNNVQNPTPLNGGFNPQAINQGNPNQVRLLTVVPGATTITSLVTNATNANQITTIPGSQLVNVGAASLTGDQTNLTTEGTGVNFDGLLFAVNSGSVTPILIAPDTGVLTTGTTGSDLGFTGGQASTVENNDDGSGLIFVAGEVEGAQGLVVLNQNGTNAPTVETFTGNPTTNALTAVTANDDFDEEGNVFATDGNVTITFNSDGDSTVNPATGGIATISGAGTDSVVTDEFFDQQGNNVDADLVVAAGPSIADELAQDANTPGINVGASFFNVNGSGVFSGTTAVGGALVNTTNSGFIQLPAAAGFNGGVVNPTSICVVANNQVAGTGDSAFVVVGTDNPGAPLVIIPFNQQTGALNLGSAQVQISQFDGQGVVGLSNDNNGTGFNGFNTQNAFVAITGSGTGSTMNAFAQTINGLSEPSLLFSNGSGTINIGNQAGVLGSATINPVVFSSNVP